jgi:hypothetical protein
MTRRLCALLFTAIILPAIQIFPAAADNLSLPVTITAFSDYQSQRTCVQSCYFLAVYGGGDLVANALKCPEPNVWALNNCWCRSDLQSIAVSYLFSCANAGCSSNSVDVNAATSLYTAYCAQMESSPSIGAGKVTTNGKRLCLKVRCQSLNGSTAAGNTVTTTPAINAQTITITDAGATATSTRVLVGATANSQVSSPKLQLTRIDESMWIWGILATTVLFLPALL